MAHQLKMTYAVAIKNSPLGRQRFLNLGRCDVPRRLMTRADTHDLDKAHLEAAYANKHLGDNGESYVVQAFKAVG